MWPLLHQLLYLKPIDKEMRSSIENILSQRFNYLTQGLQTWVWESADKKYVFKLFKDVEEGKEQFVRWGKDPNELEQSWFDNAVRSCELAFKQLQKETALIYIHTNNETAPVERVVLGDEEYNTEEHFFLVQEKVELVCDRMAALMKNGNLKGSQKIIDEVLSLISLMWRKNITEDTFNFDHNYGYTANDRLVQIDVGSFWEGEEYVCRQLTEKKLLNSDSSRWLEERYPELIEYYRDAVTRLYKDFEGSMC